MSRAKSWPATSPPCAQTTTAVKAQLCTELVLQHCAFGITIGIIIPIIKEVTFLLYISVYNPGMVGLQRLDRQALWVVLCHKQ